MCIRFQNKYLIRMSLKIQYNTEICVSLRVLFFSARLFKICVFPLKTSFELLNNLNESQLQKIYSCTLNKQNSFWGLLDNQELTFMMSNSLRVKVTKYILFRLISDLNWQLNEFQLPFYINNLVKRFIRVSQLQQKRHYIQCQRLYYVNT